MKHEKYQFFGITLRKEPSLGYFRARWGKGADVLLFQTGAGPWKATLFLGTPGNGIEVFASFGKTPTAALRALEKRTDSLVKDAVRMIAKHFATLGRQFSLAGSRRRARLRY